MKILWAILNLFSCSFFCSGDICGAEPFFCPGPGWRVLQSVFGGYEYDLVKESKGLLYELHPSRPYNLTFWLNEQSHPNIPYFSVVRASGDFMVPGYSQDMNNVLDRSVALNKIWYDDSYFNARSMDVYITKLRKYLKEDPDVELINVHGVGFKLVAS